MASSVNTGIVEHLFVGGNYYLGPCQHGVRIPTASTPDVGERRIVLIGLES